MLLLVTWKGRSQAMYLIICMLLMISFISPTRWSVAAVIQQTHKQYKRHTERRHSYRAKCVCDVRSQPVFQANKSPK